MDERGDYAYEDVLSILKGIDTVDLPEAVIIDYVLAETLNGLTAHVSHESAVDFLNRLEENTRYHIDSLTADTFATGKALFRQYERLSIVDACLLAYMQVEGLGYPYAFDDDFDVADDVFRLETASNPYKPE